MQADYDIVIAGGGMVGASLALALAGSALRIAVVESVPASAEQQPSYDDRGIALSLSSQRVFQALGIWPEIAADSSPIRRIHVSDQGHFGKLRMDAARYGLEALGHVVIARRLGAVLLNKIKASQGLDHLCPAMVEAAEQHTDHVRLQLRNEEGQTTVSCRLLVCADGTHSRLRRQLGIDTLQHDYRQTLIVSNITCDLPHHDTAFERFTGDGPLALLPLPENRCVLVFSTAAAEAAHYMALDEEAFLAVVLKRFGRRLGRLLRLGKRRSYALQQVMAREQLRGRALLLGNAAHTIHPNGAQGFNLCLRDVAGLVECLQGAAAGRVDPGDKVLLDEYLLLRTADQRRVAAQSHGIDRWFYNHQPLRALLRNVAMNGIDLLPPVQEELLRRGMGLAGKQPALVRGAPL